jgi:hypothetical protein
MVLLPKLIAHSFLLGCVIDLARRQPNGVPVLPRRPSSHRQHRCLIEAHSVRYRHQNGRGHEHVFLESIKVGLPFHEEAFREGANLFPCSGTAKDCTGDVRSQHGGNAVIGEEPMSR